MSTPTHPEPAPELNGPSAMPGSGPLKIRVFGVGGAGGNAVGALAGLSLEGVDLVALNTDAAALNKCAAPQRRVLGAKLTRGLGAGGEPERGRAAAEEDREVLRELCTGVSIVFVVAGLGGGTGTGAAPVLARIARDAGALVLAMAVMPFDCEGVRRQRQAQLGLQELKTAADGVICLPNQRILKMIDENTSLLETFAITNDLLAQGVCGIWRLLARPGLINVDFADLCAVTRGRHSESSLATAEGRGENRMREAVERLLAHPLLEGGLVLNDAGSVLVTLTGGPDLTTAQVNWVMEQISRLCEGAHIIMGTSVDDEFIDRIGITLVASRRPAPPREVERPAAGEPDETSALILEEQDDEAARPPSRIKAPPPALTPEMMERLPKPGGRIRNRLRGKQGELNLEIISKGRFEKSEPTIHQGQDLDVPTYIRRGVPLN